MNLYRITFVFILLLFISCKDLFGKKKRQEKTIEQPINYTSIDAYPLLPECEKLTRSLQKKCFYEKLVGRIKKSLDRNNTNILDTIQTKIMIKILVSSNGKVSVKPISLPQKLDSLIYLSIAELPVLKPAIKLGIPVASEFSLPILINQK